MKRRQSKLPLPLRFILSLMVISVGIFVLISLLSSSSSTSTTSSETAKANKSLKVHKQPTIDVQDNKNRHPIAHRLVGFDNNDGDKTIQLRSGALIPAIGYGTCCRKTAKGQELYESTKTFLKEGGRLIDTAMAYGNHKEIGNAIKDFQQPQINRNQIWITSKISPNKLPNNKNQKLLAANTVTAVKEIIDELGFTGSNDGYLDLCLIHTQKLGKERTIEIWKGLIEAQQLGLVKVIGVSNFNRYEIMDLYEATNVMPEVNQIQYHPWTEKEWKDTVQWQHQNHVVTTAYTSLGGSRFHTPAKKTTVSNENIGSPSYPPILTELATKYDVTEAQILLKWSLQQTTQFSTANDHYNHAMDDY